MTHEGVSHLFTTLFLREGCCLHFPHPISTLFLKSFFKPLLKTAKLRASSPVRHALQRKKLPKSHPWPSKSLLFYFPGLAQGICRGGQGTGQSPQPPHLQGKDMGCTGCPQMPQHPLGWEEGTWVPELHRPIWAAQTQSQVFIPLQSPPVVGTARGQPCQWGLGMSLPMPPGPGPPLEPSLLPGTQTSATLSPAAWDWTMGASTQNTSHKERVSGAPAGTWSPISPLFPTQNNLTFRSRVNFMKFLREKDQKSIKQKSSYFGH